MGDNSSNSKVQQQRAASRFSSVGICYHDVEELSDTYGGVHLLEVRRLGARVSTGQNSGPSGSNARGEPKRLIVPAGKGVDGQKKTQYYWDEKEDSIEATAAVEELGRMGITKQARDESTGLRRRFSSMGIRYHDVAPSDTMSSICSRYGIAASALRKANMALNGSNVQGGPGRLIIPSSTGSDDGHKKQDQRQDKEKESNAKKPAETKTADDNVTNLTSSADAIQYHDVQPNDTLQYICLKYGLKAVELRKANNFRGTNLKAAPERLIIPGERKEVGSKMSIAEELVQSFLSHCPTDRRTGKPVLSRTVAVGYLECNGWDVHQAVRNLNVDLKDKGFDPWKKTKIEPSAITTDPIVPSTPRREHQHRRKPPTVKAQPRPAVRFSPALKLAVVEPVSPSNVVSLWYSECDLDAMRGDFRRRSLAARGLPGHQIKPLPFN